MDQLFLIYSFPQGQLKPVLYENVIQANGYGNFSDNKLSPYLIVNRTDSNKQYFNLTFSQDLNLITIRHQLYSRDALEQEVYKEYDNSTTRLYQTKTSKIGLAQYAPVTLKAAAETTIEADKKPKDSIFGVVYSYSNLYTSRINIQTLDEIQISKEQTGSFINNLDISFTELITTNEYISYLDILYKIGSIGALIYMIAAALSFLLVIRYTIKLVNLIRRKNELRMKQVEIKRMTKWIPALRRDIVERL